MDDLNNQDFNREDKETETIETLQQDFVPNQQRYPVVKPNSFSTAAQICGIIAIISVFTMTIYPAMILGSLAIIFAILSKGSERKYSDRAKTGITAGIIALGMDIALVAATFMLIFSNGEFKKQLNDACEQMYGQTFDEMLEDAMRGESTFDPYNITDL
ncbi:MAG: hypothetical protein KBS96_04185 [Lachnospiraceae bacterium]|nr:hypothetical protein [Candidatus Colinaster scatohippi]